jgi:sporulation protein YlmC with PRC-barrel domain
MQTRKLALLSTMLIGLGGGAAFAQQTPDPAQDPLQQDQTDTLQHAPDQADGVTDGVTDDAIPEGGIAEEGTDGIGTDPSFTEDGADDLETDPGFAEGTSPSMTPSVTTGTEPYTQTVLGGMSADELIGMNVVDVTGESVGSISDLLIGANDTVDRAIIDVGGFLGFGAKPVALELDRLTVAEGDGEVVVDVTREELDAMPDWQRNDGGWFTE